MTETILAGLAVAALAAVEVFLITKGREEWDRRKVVKWLAANTHDEPGESHVGTFELATALGMTEDRVRSACVASPKVHRASGDREQWSVWRQEPQSVYEKRGLLTI